MKKVKFILETAYNANREKGKLKKLFSHSEWDAPPFYVMFAFYLAVYSNILTTFNIPYYVLLIE